jgi:hypothetical protein
MEARWPQFRLVAKSYWFAVWEGPLRTVLAEYVVRVQLVRPTTLESGIWIWPPQQQVWVVSPALEFHAGETRLPHTYTCSWRPANRATLCLHVPRDKDWTREDFVADKIIPWAAEWLHFYEGWLATGVFCGPGLHPGDEEVESWGNRTASPTPPANDDQPGPYRRSADNFIGRRTGTFASFPLMEVASRGSSPWPSWPSWSDVPWADGRSPPTSIWWPELPLAA